MLDRASWILRAGLILSVLISVAQAETKTIRFSDLDNHAQEYSPRAQIIGQEFERVLAERDEDLQWSNPVIAYDREDVDQAKEYQITIGKQVEVPWAYSKKRSSWKDRVKSAELTKEQSRRTHLATLKSGYVALQLLDEYLSRLERFKEALSDASHVATSRHSEGHLSGAEEHLIQMAIISLNASHQSALQERKELSAFWRANVGLGPDDVVTLATPVGFGLIDLKPVEHYTAVVESQPDYMSRSLLVESFRKRASAEKGKFIPALNVYAGLKKIDPDVDGYVAGVSLSLPLFNRNGSTARKYRIESDIARTEMQLNRTQAIGQVQALTESIAGSQGSLALASPHFLEDSEEFNNLLYSYEEGWLTLNELLNAIQIEVAGLEHYYGQLTQFYLNLFQLETITGETLVNFEE
ncbi:MAG: TolC family protein [bacterium]